MGNLVSDAGGDGNMRYDCLTLHVTSGGYNIEIASTDADTLVWIGNEVKNDRPSCRLTSMGQLTCSFSITGYEPLEVGWGLVKSLCEQGWEPFGTVRWEESWGLEFISLRRSAAGSANGDEK
jgi:hypothetical protein